MSTGANRIRVSQSSIDRLLNPRSIALVGASARADTNGLALVQMSRIDGYEGRVYPVNPNYPEIAGLRCYPSLVDIPETVDLVALAVANSHLEQAFDQAVEHGAKGIVLFGSAHLDSDANPPLIARLREKAIRSGIALCGPNSMGFYTPLVGLRVAGFPSPPGLRRGGIAYIAQSGSAFSALVHNERRLGFVVCVSSGSEIGVTAADYFEWSLQKEETRVVGLFIEQIRDPDGFRHALEQANLRDIPVVILKVGRTARSAEMALSHTGALAGNDQAFVAMCRRYGAIIVDDLDEMAATLQFFDQPRKLPAGRLASIHDSGGERELVVDIAERVGVSFAAIEETTRADIAKFLDPGHIAENPLDAWGTPNEFVRRYEGTLRALARDPGVSATIFFSDIRDGYWYSDGVVEAVSRIADETGKPIAIATNYSKTTNAVMALNLANKQIPVLEGTRASLLAYRHSEKWRDRKKSFASPASGGIADVVAAWRDKLLGSGTLSEHDGLSLLADFGVSTVKARLVSTAEEACRAFELLGSPVVLKTAEGHAHKSEVGGVHLNLRSIEEVTSAYVDLENRLGSQVQVSAMAEPGIEIGLGAVVDPTFGPMIVISAGGVLIEYLNDTVSALAPVSEAEALALLQELKMHKILLGVRGKRPANIDALAELISRFSLMIDALSDVLSEVDVNPVIAGADRAVAVDALFVPKAS